MLNEKPPQCRSEVTRVATTPSGANPDSRSQNACSKTIPQLAAAFGLAVTASSEANDHFVAKKGNWSLYAAFRQIFPQVDARARNRDL